MADGEIWVVIPALNAASTLAGMLTAVGVPEIPTVVADGGSTDATADIAVRKGALVVAAPRGRGVQLVVGADAALAHGARWLLFVHADTLLSENWIEVARAFVRSSRARECAGYFRLAFDDPDPRAERVARLANWRSRAFGLPYGDQGLLVSERLYREVGGYRPIPLTEDVDLVRRIGRSRLATLDAVATTSADRYRRGGWWLRPARNLACLALWFAGVPAERLSEFYRRRR